MKDSDINRRDFLRAAGVLTGSALLAACTSKLAEADPTATETLATLTPKVIRIPTLPVAVAPTKEKEKPAFIYFSQKDSKWKLIPDSGNGSMRRSGCSIATGAMVTFTDPYKYWDFCTDYYGQHLTLGELGWSLNFHRPVLESHGFGVKQLEGKLKAIKDEIERYTAKGIPVWVNAVFYGIEEGHNSEAIGIDYSNDPKGSIVFNDPWYGQGVAIADKHLSSGKHGSWLFGAIIPPAH